MEISLLITIVLALFPGLVALYLSVWRPYLWRPKLKLGFIEKPVFPYSQGLAFERYYPPIEHHNKIVYIHRPGRNIRIKVKNTGKTTARMVTARVEKVELVKTKEKRIVTRQYHPTMLKWSGELDWNPIDIVAKSYFFMDFLWIKSETEEDILNYNKSKYSPELREDNLRTFISEYISPSGEIYWNLWVDTSYDRGIPNKYGFEGEIRVHMFLSAENCDPIQFVAYVNWGKENWTTPSIRIISNGEFINRD